MPIVRDIILKLDMGEVFRREGIREYSKLKPEIKSIISELLSSTDSDRLLEPAIAYEIYPITEKRHDQLILAGNIVLHGSLIPSVLPEAKELAAVVCTIGPKLEKESTEYFTKNAPLRGLLLDGIGSAAVDALFQETCKLIMCEVANRGFQASSPLSPGILGFPLTEQQTLFQLARASEIGISLTTSGVMMPLKSVSMAIGIGLQMKTWTQAEVCARCSLRKTCSHRIHV